MISLSCQMLCRRLCAAHPAKFFRKIQRTERDDRDNEVEVYDDEELTVVSTSGKHSWQWTLLWRVGHNCIFRFRNSVFGNRAHDIFQTCRVADGEERFHSCAPWNHDACNGATSIETYHCPLNEHCCCPCQICVIMGHRSHSQHQVGMLWRRTYTTKVPFY